MKKIRLAIFDIDGTIFRSSLVIELINGLVEARVFPRAAKKEMEKEYLAWLNRKGSYENYINKVVKIYGKYIPGKSFKRVNNIAKNVINFHKDRVYRFTRDLIKQLKRGKYFLLAVSGSPSYIVGAYARRIGFNDFYGSVTEVKYGKFTGKVLSVDAANRKTEIIKRVIAKHHLSVDFKNSLAVGDTETDVEILRLVGKPIAFNPNLQLAKIAQKNKWQIVVERKDVVYKRVNEGYPRYAAKYGIIKL